MYVETVAMQLDFLTTIFLTAMALCAGVALVLSFLHWSDWKAQKAEQGNGPVLKRAKAPGGLLLTVLNKLQNRFRRRLTPGEIQRPANRTHVRAISRNRRRSLALSSNEPREHPTAIRA